MVSCRHRFTLLEVVIVLVIAAFAMSIIVPAFNDRSSGQVKIEMLDKLNKAFSSAAIRSQSFGRQVKITFKYEPEESFTCSLENEVLDPELPTIDPEEMTEEEQSQRRQNKINENIWTGENTYNFPSEVKLENFQDIINDNNEIIYRFYPDGESTGPAMKLAIGELRFEVMVDRLKGQLIVHEVNDLL